MDKHRVGRLAPYLGTVGIAVLLGLSGCTSARLGMRVAPSAAPTPSPAGLVDAVPSAEAATPSAGSPSASPSASSQSSVSVQQSNSSSSVSVNGSSVSTSATSSAATTSCAASISDPNPDHDGSETVTVSSNVPKGGVMVIVNYKGTKPSFMASTDGEGKATVTFSIGKQAAGYVVLVDVSVDGQALCRTSFTPR